MCYKTTSTDCNTLRSVQRHWSFKIFCMHITAIFYTLWTWVHFWLDLVLLQLASKLSEILVLFLIFFPGSPLKVALRKKQLGLYFPPGASHRVHEAQPSIFWNVEGTGARFGGSCPNQQQRQHLLGAHGREMQMRCGESKHSQIRWNRKWGEKKEKHNCTQNSNEKVSREREKA